MALNSGALNIKGGVSSVFSDVSGTGAAAILNSTTDPRARLTFGVAYQALSGPSIELSGFYDGIGASSYESYGLDAKLEWPF